MSTASPRLTIIVAMDARRGIGIGNTLPWRIPEDMRHFRETTTGHVVVMGRKTYESIGRPLPNRINIVLSKQPDWFGSSQALPNLYTAASLEEALRMASSVPATRTFVIGGSQIYRQALPLAQELIITRVKGDYGCDAFFPSTDEFYWSLVSTREVRSPSLHDSIRIDHFRRDPVGHHPV